MTGWKKIRGHNRIKNYFMDVLSKDDVFHAYMLCGESGCGKRLLADTFAMALLCEHNGERPCGVCDSCMKAEALSHPDIIYVNHEKPGSISVDEIRKQLVVPMSVKPYFGKYKVFIIDDAEIMTPQAQNALLKTLEEPPEYGVVILLTSNENVMLQTILSRTVSLYCGNVSKSEVKSYLIDECQIPDYKAEICSVFAQGNIGKAISLATMEDFYTTKDAAITLAKIIPRTDVIDLISRMKEISDYKNRIDKYLDFLYVWYHDVLIYKATADANFCLFSDELSDIVLQAERFSYSGLETVLAAVNDAKVRLKANVSFELVIELLLMKIKDCME